MMASVTVYESCVKDRKNKELLEQAVRNQSGRLPVFALHNVFAIRPGITYEIVTNIAVDKIEDNVVGFVVAVPDLLADEQIKIEPFIIHKPTDKQWKFERLTATYIHSKGETYIKEGQYLADVVFVPVVQNVSYTKKSEDLFSFVSDEEEPNEKEVKEVSWNLHTDYHPCCG